MFIIKSNVSETFQFQTDIEKARTFFSDGKNYVELMPNLESIQTDIRGVTRWNIAVAVPLIGSWKMSFAVDFLMTDDMIEWYPSPIENQNFLRCLTQIVKKDADIVQVQLSHNLELRRKRASEFHPLASMAGEGAISAEMESAVKRMLKTFMQKAKERLEKQV